MKKFLASLILTVFLAAGIAPASCLAYVPLRVAILPVFNSSDIHDQATEQVISNALKARFHMPLSNVITLYEVVPDNEVRLALPPELINPNKPGKISSHTLQEIGAKLKTDVVIGAQITDFTLFTFTNWDGDLIQQTDLTIRVFGYDTTKNEFLDIHDRQYYNDEASIRGYPDYLAQQIMDNLLKKVPYTWKR